MSIKFTKKYQYMRLREKNIREWLNYRRIQEIRK